MLQGLWEDASKMLYRCFNPNIVKPSSIRHFCMETMNHLVINTYKIGVPPNIQNLWQSTVLFIQPAVCFIFFQNCSKFFWQHFWTIIDPSRGHYLAFPEPVIHHPMSDTSASGASTLPPCPEKMSKTSGVLRHKYRLPTWGISETNKLVRASMIRRLAYQTMVPL